MISNLLKLSLSQTPVRVALCFGSQATGSAHRWSDIDLAVKLDGIQPGDKEYNDAFFAVYAEVADVLDRDDVDLVDLHSLSGTLAQAVFEPGIIIYGGSQRSQRVKTLRDEYETNGDDRSPRERLDRAIERMDEYLA